MRKVIERIWQMHENSISGDNPLQEKVLWLNIQYAIKYTKARSTMELGINKLVGESENVVRFKVIKVNKKK